jgi:hypothetical protein
MAIRLDSCALVVLLLAAGAFTAITAPADAATRPKKGSYGAIAYEPVQRAVGYSFDLKSARDAKVEALKQCGEPGCVVILNFRNACGALVRARGKPFTATGATREEAQTKALNRCADRKCEVIAWACTK